MDCMVCKAPGVKRLFWRIGGTVGVQAFTYCEICVEREYSVALGLGYQVYCSECSRRPAERVKNGYPACGVCLTHDTPMSASRCECGAERCKLPIHSTWCPKADK